MLWKPLHLWLLGFFYSRLCFCLVAPRIPVPTDASGYYLMGMSKISVSLPTEIVSDLDYLAVRTGVSRSALIGQLLQESVPEVRRILELVPPNPTPAEMLRMRGQSEDLIRERLQSLKGMTDDLFTSK